MWEMAHMNAYVLVMDTRFFWLPALVSSPALDLAWKARWLDVPVNLAFAHMCPYSLSELQGFIKQTDAGLQRQLREGDHGGLVDIMGHLLAVRSRQRHTDELFDPLKQTIMLLENYGQKMPEQVYVQLEVSAHGTVLVTSTRVTPPGRSVTHTLVIA